MAGSACGQCGAWSGHYESCTHYDAFEAAMDRRDYAAADAELRRRRAARAAKAAACQHDYPQEFHCRKCQSWVETGCAELDALRKVEEAARVINGRWLYGERASYPHYARLRYAIAALDQLRAEGKA